MNPILIPCNSAITDDPERRFWMMTTAAAGRAAVVATAIPFVSTLAPSERAKAAGGPVEVDISDIPPGGIKTVEWRGKPVWVVRRTPEMLAALQGRDGDLVDPRSAKEQQPSHAKNAARAIKPEVFVSIGIHLGCPPSDAPKGASNPSLPTDWPGGFFCPCRGSILGGRRAGVQEQTCTDQPRDPAAPLRGRYADLHRRRRRSPKEIDHGVLRLDAWRLLCRVAGQALKDRGRTDPCISDSCATNAAVR